MGTVDLSNRFTNKCPSYIQYHKWKITVLFYLHDIRLLILILFCKNLEKTHGNQFTDCSLVFGQPEFRELLALSLMGLNDK